MNRIKPEPLSVDQPCVITGVIVIGTQVRTGIACMIPRTGQSPDRPPAHATLSAAGIRIMTGQEAPVSVAHARMLNHTLDRYQHVKPYHSARDKVTASGNGKITARVRAI